MILLDTHAWVWYVDENDELSDMAARTIDQALHVGICSISCWEVATLVRKGRLELSVTPETSVEQALNLPGVELIPLPWRAATRAGTEQFNFDKDPADRMIAATAAEQDIPLVTKDTRLHECQFIKTIW